MNPVNAGGRDGSFVISEWLGEKPGAGGTMLENVGDADSGRQPFDSRLDQLQIARIGETDGGQPLGLEFGHITGSWTAGGVRVLMVTDQRLPMRVTRSLD